MVLYTVYNGFALAGQEALVLDPCSDYAACMSSQDVQATVTIRPVFGQNPVFSQTYQCSQGYQRILAPQDEGIYIVDVGYELNGQSVGRDRALLPVARSVSEYSPPIDDATVAMIIGVDNISGLGVTIPVRRGENVALPTSGRFTAYALYKRSWDYGCAVLPDGSSVCGYAARIDKELRYNRVDDMVNHLVQMVSVYRPELQLWMCSLRGADAETVANAFAPFLALRYAALGAIVAGWEVDTDNNRLVVHTILPLGALHGWLAILSDVAFGCASGAAAAVWLAGVGAAAGCLVGAAVGFTVGVAFHADELTSPEVETIYSSGAAKINAAANKALTDLENLYKQGYVNDKAYNILKRDIENLRNIALEQLRILRNAVENVPTEKKLMYVAMGLLGGIALSTLLRK